MSALKKQNTNILIVDDTPDNIRLLAKILESQNYRVRKSLNGKAALQAALRDPPDLILLDVNMPQPDGYEVCKQLKTIERTADIPIIFISAFDQVNYKVRAFEVGGQDYITKPFQELEVLARVKTHLTLKQQRQKLQDKIQDHQDAEVKIQRLNIYLERQVQSFILELQQSLSCELALKHISEQVRDSLDQHQILQATVEALAWALDVRCCDASLYDADHSTSTIRYQWVEPNLNATQGQTVQTSEFPEIFQQLQDRMCFAFCQTQPSPIRNHSAILACPIFDDQVTEVGILGDLWLFRETYSSFSEMEIHLVQQAANYCAIALRQARLYEAAQAQIKELEHLNQLKDNFLNSISHELRTPIANMKMLIDLLYTAMNHRRTLIEEMSISPTQDANVIKYLTVLQDECEHELSLVEDLLNLQHIEAGNYGSEPIPIRLQDWLLHLLEPFEVGIRAQQQILQVRIDPNLPVLSLDTRSFDRIITELLNNAYKYTPTGEKILVSADIFLDKSKTEPTRYLQVTVTNTGVEIPLNELPRIFDTFYRIPNVDRWGHGGTGLGLALVKKLVEHMSGTIHAESSDNQTRFTVLMKVCESCIE